MRADQSLSFSGSSALAPAILAAVDPSFTCPPPSSTVRTSHHQRIPSQTPTQRIAQPSFQMNPMVLPIDLYPLYAPIRWNSLLPFEPGRLSG